MEQIVRLTPDQLAEAVNLADEVFRVPGQKSMGEAFPYIFDAGEPESLGILENGKLVCFMGVVPGCIRVGQARLHVYSLGSVCTLPEARGKGFATRLLKQVIAHIEEAGASLLLISGNLPLYLNAGCRPFGSIRQFTLESSVIRNVTKAIPAKALTFRTLQPGDSFVIADLLSRQAASYELSLYDIELLLNAESYASCLKLTHQTWVAESPDGEMAAFAVIGLPEAGQEAKSAPLVIEFAGDPQALSALLQHVMEQDNLQQLSIAVSPFQTGLARELDQLGFQSKPGRNSGTVKIIDPVRLWNQLKPYMAAQSSEAARISVAISDDPISSSGEQRIVLLLDDKPAALLEESETLALLFDGPDSVQLPESLLALLNPVLPIPFPYTYGLYYI